MMQRRVTLLSTLEVADCTALPAHFVVIVLVRTTDFALYVIRGFVIVKKLVGTCAVVGLGVALAAPLRCVGVTEARKYDPASAELTT